MRRNIKDELSSELIKAVKERLLEDRNMVTFFMETLSIGKEAVYRRLRGEVPFSFYETVLIAKDMGLSLDEIAGNSVKNEALFALNLQKTENPFDYIYGICHSYHNIYTFMKDDPSSVISTASSILPFFIYARYKTLTRFRLRRWVHQYHGMKIVEDINENLFPEKLINILESLPLILREIPRTDILWDQNVFHSLVQDMKYFVELEIISKDEVVQLKKEFLELLDEIENLACNGGYPNGNKVNIYISSIDFEASYTHMEKPGFQLSVFHLFAIDYIHSQNPDICYEQKRWIDSLKRYSTLISQCAEKQRMTFFNKQREYVNSL